MPKNYLRYEQLRAFGSIYSSTGNCVFDATAKLAVCPALENVAIWHLRQGTQVGIFRAEDNKARVTRIIRAPKSFNERVFAVGYEDGTIRLWNLDSHECIMRLNGHKSAITTLRFNQEGTLLASGSKDTDIILWDVIAETGLHKFKGSKDQVTDLVFLHDDGKAKFLISSSKDTIIRVWDLLSLHCIETVIGHRSEVWSICLLKNESVLVSGSSEAELKVWSVDKEALAAKLKIQENSEMQADDQEMDLKGNLGIKLVGHVDRSSKERVASLMVDYDDTYLACHSGGSTVEFFAIRNREDMKKLLKKRQKKMNEGETAEVTAVDYLLSKRVYKSKFKISSFDFYPKSSDSLRFLLGYTDNSVGQLKLTESLEIESEATVDHQGHRSDIRTIAVSSDDSMILTACDLVIKLWNTTTGNCIRTLPSTGGKPTSSLFLPGNKHVIIATRDGTLDLYDCQSCTLLESIAAHSGPIWSIDMRPDKGGIASGGDDKTVKFWDFGAVEDLNYSKTSRRLTLFHMRTLELSDEVRCVKYSPDQKIIAVALLDSTVKVFYHDTLKFFLSLYGHKLPVTCMDISSDNSLLVSGSSDKNVKLWGLDFGDCHRSILAHDDALTDIRFVPQTHYFFTCSKDKTVKYFDGDSFEQIMLVGKHHGEVRSLTLGKWGNLVFSAGQDKCIKVFEKTEEPLFLEEEREKELEEQIDQEVSAELDENGVAKSSPESMKAGERLAEALSIAEEHWSLWKVYKASEGKIPKPELNPILQAFKCDYPEQYVLRVLEKLKSADLEPCLWTIPFSKLPAMLSCVLFWTERNLNPVLTVNVLSFLLKTNINQLGSTGLKTHDDLYMDALLIKIKESLHASLQKQKDIVGFNIAALKAVRTMWEQEHVNEMIEWEAELQQKFQALKTSSKKKKRPIKVFS